MLNLIALVKLFYDGDPCHVEISPSTDWFLYDAEPRRERVEDLPYLQGTEINITTGIHTDIRITLGYYRMMGSVVPCFPTR